MAAKIIFKKNSKVQAIDPLSGVWLHATIIDVKGTTVKVSWVGYDAKFNCWLEESCARKPFLGRSLLSRNAISAKCFPKTKHPKKLQKDDEVFDTVRRNKYTIETNDPFKSEVTTTAGTTILYEFLKEYEGEIESEENRTEISEDEQMPEQIPEKIPAEIPEQIPEEAPEEIPEEMPGQIPRDIRRDETTDVDASDVLATLDEVFMPIFLGRNEPRQLPCNIGTQTDSDLTTVLFNEIHLMNNKLDEVIKRTNAIETLLQKKIRKKENCVCFSAEASSANINGTLPFNVVDSSAETNTSEPTFAGLFRDSLIPQNEFYHETEPDFEMDEIATDTPLSSTIQQSPLAQSPSLASGSMQETSNKVKKKSNPCSAFIKAEMSKRFSEEELIHKRYCSATRVVGGKKTKFDALSPARLKGIIGEARKRYGKEFAEMRSLKEVINSKCRQVKCQSKKT